MKSLNRLPTYSAKNHLNHALKSKIMLSVTCTITHELRLQLHWKPIEEVAIPLSTWSVQFGIRDTCDDFLYMYA